ncbi:MAG: trifunctional transcriptional regulator/proline dehydrogenase/L-glutamate gamma-semialdehyde, partial [Pseudomonadota bacterium]
AAPDAVYPQFATHNAHSLAAIYQMAGPERYHPTQYEFQCLHGMGEPLYEQVVGKTGEGKLGRPCRIYAPVGTHETLLAYLVRRLLENGANTSFVNRIADPSIAIETLVEDPVATVDRWAADEGTVGLPHASIPQPLALYGLLRVNSAGLDLANETTLAALGEAVRRTCQQSWDVAPLLAFDSTAGTRAEPVLNPANHADPVGSVRSATPEEVEAAVGHAQVAFPAWAATAPAERAALLERAADLMQDEIQPLIGLLIREAGKTAANAIAEVREAIDFLRYYAAQVRTDFSNDTHLPLGPVVCISPWNFPLAIFTGQVAAALAAGNTVLAKPAEQTPVVAHYAVRLLWQAGVPRSAVQLLTGSGSRVGAQLVADPRVQGVMFTGSTEVARILQATLAQRLSPAGKSIPLVAETGGQNCMVVDSSALAEQVVNDVVASAFDSAGQRCSALRVLCLQEEIADRVIQMLKGAMAEQRLGSPDALKVDIGPVIDAEARDGLLRHIDAMRARGRPVFQQARVDPGVLEQGSFIVPTLIEIGHVGELEREIFGPVLHVLRYQRRELGALIEQINGTGYGLTFGIHTRIDETIARAVESVHAGNLYVNRNMVGAVVGVQPFGGEGLSGTGPKAGGPLYLYRLLARHPSDAMARGLLFSGGAERPAPRPALQALREWAQAAGDAGLAAACDQFATLSFSGASVVLAGPTGERNRYQILPRQAVLSLASQDADRLVQLAATLAVGSLAVWPASAAALRESLPQSVRERIALADDWRSPIVHFDAVLHHGEAAELRELCAWLARRPGPIVGIQSLAPGDSGVAIERLVIERSVSVNTAAAGGNASLMTLE